MTPVDLDDELRRALREWPEEASPGFNRRLLERLGERPRRGRLRLRPAVAASCGALLLALTLLGTLSPQRPFEADPAVPREELLSEYRALEMELEQLRRLASEPPVLYLGGDETFDLVFDLADYRQVGREETARPAVLPDRG